jgi:hypothetical protein
MDIVPFLIEKRLLEPTRPEPPRTSSDWLVWKSEQDESYILGYDGDHWACHNKHVTSQVRNPVDRVVVHYDKLPDRVQEFVLSFYPDNIEVTLTEEMKKAMIICVPTGFKVIDYMFKSLMAVYVPDIFMPPGHDPYNASIIERSPGRTHPHTPSNKSDIDNLCMCSECKHMPGFTNEASAYSNVRGELFPGVYYTNIEFDIGPHQFRPLFNFRSCHICPYRIDIPVSQETVPVDLDVFQSYTTLGGQLYLTLWYHSLTGFLAWIGNNLNRSGTARSLRKVIVTTSTPYTETAFIRFKRDAGANLFLLFSHSPVAINKKHASVVISYHDMCMVCRAWDSFQPRPNSDYLRSRGQSDIPPVFRSIFALANMGQFLTKPNQLESPLHQNLPTMPGAVVDLIGQYLCIGASSSDDPNGAKNSMSRPVAGTNAGTWSILFLAESFDPIVLDKICEFLYKR